MKKIRQTRPEFCPFCNSSLIGGPIPKEDQHFFGQTHWSRKIGLYDRGKDMTTEYECPDCKKRWPAEDCHVI